MKKIFAFLIISIIILANTVSVFAYIDLPMVTNWSEDGKPLFSGGSIATESNTAEGWAYDQVNEKFIKVDKDGNVLESHDDNPFIVEETEDTVYCWVDTKVTEGFDVDGKDFCVTLYNKDMNKFYYIYCLKYNDYVGRVKAPIGMYRVESIMVQNDVKAEYVLDSDIREFELTEEDAVGLNITLLQKKDYSSISEEVLNLPTSEDFDKIKEEEREDEQNKENNTTNEEVINVPKDIEEDKPEVIDKPDEIKPDEKEDGFLARNFFSILAIIIAIVAFLIYKYKTKLDD